MSLYNGDFVNKNRIQVIHIPKKKVNLNYIIILNVIGTISYQAINFLLTPILTRALGQYDFGVVTLYTSWINILLPILSLNVESVLPLVPINIKQKDQPRYVSSLAGLTLVAFTIFTVICLIFLKPISAFLQFEPIVVIMLLLQCLGTTLVNFIINYFIQYQKTIYQFVFSIGVSISTFLFTLLLLKFITDEKNKYLCRIVGFAVPYIIIGLIALIIILTLSRKMFCTDVWKYALPICIPFVFHSLSHHILNQSGKVILQNAVEDGMVAVAFFGFAYTIATIMQVIWTALNNAWIPYYYKLLASDEKEAIKKSSNRYMVLYTGLFMAFALVVPEVTKFMGGETYYGSEKLVLLLLLGIYAIFMYSFPVNFKTYQKRTLSIAVGTIIASIINVVVCIVLTTKLSFWGTSIAIVVAYLTLFLIHQFTIRSKKNNTDLYVYGFKFFVPGFLLALVSCGLSYVLLEHMLIRWIVAFTIGFALLGKIIKQKNIF